MYRSECETDKKMRELRRPSLSLQETRATRESSNFTGPDGSRAVKTP